MDLDIEDGPDKSAVTIMENRKLVLRGSLGTLDTATKADENRLRAREVNNETSLLEEMKRFNDGPAPSLLVGG